MKTAANLQNHSQHVPSKHFFKSVSTKIIAQQQPEDQQLLAKNIITFHIDDLDKVIRNFEWRSKTEFPIIKTISWALVQNTENKAIMQVIHQIFEISLVELRDIPLFKILYLLKQSLIGFERLYSKFGSIKITAGMVGISSQRKCKVWLNQNFACNDPVQTNSGEYGVLTSIYEIFQTRCKKLRSNINFFQELRKLKTFYSALSFIDNYSKQNRLNIPCLYQSFKTTQFRNHKVSLELGPKTIKAPSFLNQISAQIAHQHQDQNFSPIKYLKEIVAQNYENLNMKKSGQTAVDNSASKSSSESFSIDNQKINKMRFSNNQKESEKGVTKSQVQFKQKSSLQLRFCRKLGDNYFVHPQNCTSQSAFNKMQTQRHLSSALQNQASQNSPYKVNSLFNQNKWQQKIASLFQYNGMKQSIHQGKQPAWNLQNDPRKLYLLASIGKNVAESVIPEQEN